MTDDMRRSGENPDPPPGPPPEPPPAPPEPPDAMAACMKRVLEGCPMPPHIVAVRADCSMWKEISSGGPEECRLIRYYCVWCGEANSVRRLGTVQGCNRCGVYHCLEPL